MHGETGPGVRVADMFAATSRQQSVAELWQKLHMAPPADRVAKLMTDLLDWLENTDEHPLVVSCVFHYEFGFIHLTGKSRRWLQRHVVE